MKTFFAIVVVVCCFLFFDLNKKTATTSVQLRNDEAENILEDYERAALLQFEQLKNQDKIDVYNRFEPLINNGKKVEPQDKAKAVNEWLIQLGQKSTTR